MKIMSEKIQLNAPNIGEGKDGRYRFDGDILKGIVQYLEIINHMKKRDGK